MQTTAPERYTVSRAARQVGVHASTLRQWEDAGRIPRAKRTSSNRRYYTPEDIARIRKAIFPEEEWAS